MQKFFEYNWQVRGEWEPLPTPAGLELLLKPINEGRNHLL